MYYAKMLSLVAANKGIMKAVKIKKSKVTRKKHARTTRHK